MICQMFIRKCQGEQVKDLRSGEESGLEEGGATSSSKTKKKC